MDEENKTGIFDSNNKEYKLYDIVYNPFFGDYWVVQKSEETDEFECPFCLALYNNKDNYCIELDEPTGFEIVSSKGDKEYLIILNKIISISEELKRKGFL